MKTFPPSLSQPLVLASLLVLGALALPTPAHAKPDKKAKSSKQDKKAGKVDDHRDTHGSDNRKVDHDREERVRYYNTRPRATFSLNLGTGYAGRGYYYGPPNVPYYYERSDVRYYRTQEAAPREYWQREESRRVSEGVSVQRALARAGYYQRGIDGDIGPYSRSCIVRYQADHGLRQTGLITPSLLRSLGLE